ncbi:MAG: OmpA family protein [Chitinophagaceae bacterium]
MFKPLQLLVALLCAFVSYGQKSDTLVIFYKTDEYSLSKPDRQRLDSFILLGWDKIAINGYTDETDEEDYNLDLSSRRAGEVYRYIISRKVAEAILSQEYFGETRPASDNSSDEGRAQNRRTEIIGLQYAKTGLRRIQPPADPMLPVTRTLDNGFMITYRPGSLPQYIADNFENGSGENFQLLKNTTQMRQNNLYNNTTNGELLSSVLIFRGNRFNPCKLDTPVFVRVPVPFEPNCPIRLVKLFSAVEQSGSLIWQEETKQLAFDTIGGITYMGVWMDDFCKYTNFDFKIDPGCYELDSTQVLYTQGRFKNLSAELKDMNSLYLPRRINDSTHSLVFIKNRPHYEVLNFALFNGKKRIRSFADQPLSSLPYNESTGQYVLGTGSCKFSFRGLSIFNMVLRVNKDKYRMYTFEKKECEILYLNRPTENILVDFTVIDRKGRLTQFKNQSLVSFSVDPVSGYRIIDKDHLKRLKEKGVVAGL